MTAIPNKTVHRAGASRFLLSATELLGVGFAADARFPAPVGNFFR